MEQCPVCIDTFTNKTRKKISCPFCQYSACLQCVKTYLLTNVQNANCMNCHAELNREFLDDNLPYSFRNNEYKKHRERTLVEREKMLLPETVAHAEAEKQKRDTHNVLKQLQERKARLQKEINDINDEVKRITRKYHAGNVVNDERRVFIKACVMDGCRGFLSTKWKCGICSTWVCKDCHEVKYGENDNEHVCKPENVASAKLLAKETKPCPKCAAAIYRVSGCSQMWCVQCHTTFDWSTGRQVVTNNIHNPHYYEWMRRNNQEIPRAQGDNPQACNNALPQISIVYNVNKRYLYVPKCSYVANLHRSITHISHYEVPRLRVDNIATANRDLRIKYLLNDVDEKRWMSELQRREKSSEFQNAKQQVMEMFALVGTDLIKKYVADALSPHNVYDIVDEMQALVEYYNVSMQKVFNRFGSKATRLKVNQDTWVCFT